MSTTTRLYNLWPDLHSNMADCWRPSSRIYIFGLLSQKSHSFQWLQLSGTCSHRSRRLAHIGCKEHWTPFPTHLSHRSRPSRFFHCSSFCVNFQIRSSIRRWNRWIHTWSQTMSDPNRILGLPELGYSAFLLTTIINSAYNMIGSNAVQSQHRKDQVIVSEQKTIKYNGIFSR